jgi:hypothetical protein
MGTVLDAQAGTEEGQENDLYVHQLIQPGNGGLKEVPHNDLDKDRDSHLKNHEKEHILLQTVQRPTDPRDHAPLHA